MSKNYEVVIGLEVHVELGTETKIFCGCSTAFGSEPNTQTCPVCMGMPGALPVLNEKVVEYAITAGLATNCEIARYGKQDRKNYFYPDLPKAYQISQFDLPLCQNGYIDIESEEGTKRIGITRIHIEEDAGKLTHESDGGSLIDYNRCGVPLIEIVSEPDMGSAEEAKLYLQKIRAMMMYAGVSECKMNEGSFRCDVNVSVREKGQKELGTRAELKNMNSFNFIGKAIDYETKRQIALIEAGEKVLQETRRWDTSKGKSLSMRTKENAHDYRYFPDPDLVPITISESKIEKIKSMLPVLPDDRKKVYVDEYGLSNYDAEQIVSSRYVADYFEEVIKQTKDVKMVANLLMTYVFRLMANREDDLITISPNNFAELVKVINEGMINQTIAKKVVDEMWQKDESPKEIIERLDLKQITDIGELKKIAHDLVINNEKIVKDYQSGKQKALQALIGMMMRETKGKANPQIVKDILIEVMNK